MAQCIECGNNLPPRCTVTCSKECRNRRLYKSEAFKRAKVKARRSAQYKAAEQARANRRDKPCERCGEPTNRRFRFCSRKCSAQRPEWKDHCKAGTRRMIASSKLATAMKGTKGKTPFRQGCCSVCVEPVLWRGRGQTCSTRCAETVKRRRRKGRHRIRREEVFQRDDYLCWICGLATNPKARVPELDAPTVDHVIPRAFGGTHDPENLRCAHLSCNSRRGVGDDPKAVFAV